MDVRRPFEFVHVLVVGHGSCKGLFIRHKLTFGFDVSLFPPNHQLLDSFKSPWSGLDAAGCFCLAQNAFSDVFVSFFPEELDFVYFVPDFLVYHTVELVYRPKYRSISFIISSHIVPNIVPRRTASSQISFHIVPNTVLYRTILHDVGRYLNEI